MTPTQQAGADRRGAVLEALRLAARPVAVAELAEGLAMPLATVRFHLGALVADGVAQRIEGAPTGPGRPPVRFAATAAMDPHGRTSYQVLAGVLVGALADRPDPAAEATAAGRAWGAEVLDEPSPRPVGARQAVTRAVEVLDDLGFAPLARTRAGRRQIVLRRCPFLDLAKENTAVVCSVHLGIMQGTLDRLQAPVTVERLVPFAEPGVCVAHLAPTGVGA